MAWTPWSQPEQGDVHSGFVLQSHFHALTAHSCWLQDMARAPRAQPDPSDLSAPPLTADEMQPTSDDGEGRSTSADYPVVDSLQAQAPTAAHPVTRMMSMTHAAPLPAPSP